MPYRPALTLRRILTPAALAALTALLAPITPMAGKISPEQGARIIRRQTRAKRPARFRYYRGRVRYHFDPATSNANRRKRTTGQDFNGISGQHILA